VRLASGHGAHMRMMVVAVADTITIRSPRLRDGGSFVALVRASGSLDVNSSYLYHLLADHFSSTCAYAEADGEPVGFVSGYRLPDDPACLFIWQITVSPAFRGCGVGRMLLDDLARRPWFHRIERVCCTISPSNEASRGLFAKWCKSLGGHWQEMPYLRTAELGEGHEDEPMLMIVLSRAGSGV